MADKATTTVPMRTQGRVVIPSEIRNELDLVENQLIEIRIQKLD